MDSAPECRSEGHSQPSDQHTLLRPPPIVAPPVVAPPVVAPPVLRPPPVMASPVLRPPPVMAPPVLRPPPVMAPPVLAPPVVAAPPVMAPPVVPPVVAAPPVVVAPPVVPPVVLVPPPVIEPPPVEEEERVTPMAHQVEAIQAIISSWNDPETSNGYSLNDDMGLGKTITSLSAIMTHSAESDRPPRVVVSAPVTTINSTWVPEIRRVFGSRVYVLIYEGVRRFNALEEIWNKYVEHPLPLFVLTSHQGPQHELKRAGEDSDFTPPLYQIERGYWVPELKAARARPWDYLVVDESHVMRNPATQTFQATNLIPRTYTLLLTGTPFNNNPMDMATQCILMQLPVPLSSYPVAEGTARRRMSIKSIIESPVVEWSLPPDSTELFNSGIDNNQRSLALMNHSMIGAYRRIRDPRNRRFWTITHLTNPETVESLLVQFHGLEDRWSRTLKTKVKKLRPKLEHRPHDMSIEQLVREVLAVLLSIEDCMFELILTPQLIDVPGPRARTPEPRARGGGGEGEEHEAVEEAEVADESVSEAEEMECPICMSEPDLLAVTNCGHRFCYGCIQRWSGMSDEGVSQRCCPMCRSRITSIEVDEEYQSDQVLEPNLAPSIYRMLCRMGHVTQWRGFWMYLSNVKDLRRLRGEARQFQQSVYDLSSSFIQSYTMRRVKGEVAEIAIPPMHIRYEHPHLTEEESRINREYVDSFLSSWSAFNQARHVTSGTGREAMSAMLAVVTRWRQAVTLPDLIYANTNYWVDAVGTPMDHRKILERRWATGQTGTRLEETISQAAERLGMEEDSTIEGTDIPEHIQMIPIAPTGTKMNAIIRQCVLSQEEGSKLIVFSSWVTLLLILREHLSSAGIGTTLISGSMTMKRRNQVIEEFKKSPDQTVMLGSLKACGVGLNLTCATRIIFCEPSWNPFGEELQAMQRIHRIGQQEETETIYMVTRTHDRRSTIDGFMQELQDGKVMAALSILGDSYVAEHQQVRVRGKEKGKLARLAQIIREEMGL